MKKDTCWKLFAFSSMDYKAAQAWLDQRAKEGWELVELLGPLAKLRRTDRTDLTYFLDWTDAYYSEPGDYLQLCADAGWELRESMDRVNIYVSRPGACPVPLQTDPEVEYQRFQSKTLRRFGISLLFTAGLYAILFLMLSGRRGPVTLFTLLTYSNAMAFLFVTLPFLLLLSLFQAIGLGTGILRWRRAVKAREAPPPPEERAVAARRASVLLYALYLLVFYGFFLADALLGNRDTASGLGLFTGVSIGAFIIWERYKKGDPKRKKALYILPCATLFLACTLMGSQIGHTRPRQIPSGPLLGTVSGSSYTETFLGSQARWGEYAADPSRPGRSTSFDVDVRVCPSPRLAGLIFGPIPADMAPVDGMEGVWKNADANPSYLIRRGDTQLTVSPQVLIVSLRGMTFDIGPDRNVAIGVDILPPALAWLDSIE